MAKYDFIKTIAVISCEKPDAEILSKIDRKKLYLKHEIDKISDSLTHCAYYIQIVKDVKHCIVFNGSLNFMKYLAFEYERGSFFFTIVEEDGFQCQYFEKEDLNRPSFKWNPHVEVETWHNSMIVDTCGCYKITHAGINDFELSIPQTVLENINATIERNLGKEYDKSRFEKDINMVGWRGRAFRIKANKYLSPYTSRQFLKIPRFE